MQTHAQKYMQHTHTHTCTQCTRYAHLSNDEGICLYICPYVCLYIWYVHQQYHLLHMDIYKKQLCTLSYNLDIILGQFEPSLTSSWIRVIFWPPPATHTLDITATTHNRVWYWCRARSCVCMFVPCVDDGYVHECAVRWDIWYMHVVLPYHKSTACRSVWRYVLTHKKMVVYEICLHTTHPAQTRIEQDTQICEQCSSLMHILSHLSCSHSPSRARARAHPSRAWWEIAWSFFSLLSYQTCISIRHDTHACSRSVCEIGAYTRIQPVFEELSNEAQEPRRAPGRRKSEWPNLPLGTRARGATQRTQPWLCVPQHHTLNTGWSFEVHDSERKGSFRPEEIIWTQFWSRINFQFWSRINFRLQIFLRKKKKNWTIKPT